MAKKKVTYARKISCARRSRRKIACHGSGKCVRHEEVLAFALKDQDVSEYHYRFYHVLARLAAIWWSEEAQSKYASLHAKK